MDSLKTENDNGRAFEGIDTCAETVWVEYYRTVRYVAEMRRRGGSDGQCDEGIRTNGEFVLGAANEGEFGRGGVGDRFIFGIAPPTGVGRLAVTNGQGYVACYDNFRNGDAIASGVGSFANVRRIEDGVQGRVFHGRGSSCDLGESVVRQLYISEEGAGGSGQHDRRADNASGVGRANIEQDVVSGHQQANGDGCEVDRGSAGVDTSNGSSIGARCDQQGSAGVDIYAKLRQRRGIRILASEYGLTDDCDVGLPGPNAERNRKWRKDKKERKAKAKAAGRGRGVWHHKVNAAEQQLAIQRAAIALEAQTTEEFKKTKIRADLTLQQARVMENEVKIKRMSQERAALDVRDVDMFLERKRLKDVLDTEKLRAGALRAASSSSGSKVETLSISPTSSISVAEMSRCKKQNIDLEAEVAGLKTRLAVVSDLVVTEGGRQKLDELEAFYDNVVTSYTMENGCPVSEDAWGVTGYIQDGRFVVGDKYE